MKKNIKAILAMLLLLNIISINCNAEDFSNLKENLNSLGISEEYSENIVEYLDDLRLSEIKLNDLADNAVDIISVVGEKDSIDDFTISEFYQIYNKGIAIADDLNLGVDINLGDRSFEIVDKDTKSTLFKGDINDVKEIYSNYITNDYNVSLDSISDLIAKEDLEEKDISEYSNDSEENADYLNNDMNIKDNTETNEESNQDDIEKYIAEIKSENISNEENNLNSNKIFAISAGALLLIILVKIIFS